jgi:hypothetical protein
VRGIEQLRLLRAKELFPGSDIVRKYSFIMIDSGDVYALLARANHRLAQDLAILGQESAHFFDCFECLSPHETAA